MYQLGASTCSVSRRVPPCCWVKCPSMARRAEVSAECVRAKQGNQPSTSSTGKIRDPERGNRHDQLRDPGWKSRNPLSLASRPAGI